MASLIRSAQIVEPGENLEETLDFLTDVLGFRIEMITPADDPTVGVVSGHGLTLRLDCQHRGPPGTVRLQCENPASIAAGGIHFSRIGDGVTVEGARA